MFHRFRHAINARIDGRQGELSVRPLRSLRHRLFKLRRRALPVARLKQCQTELIVSHVIIRKQLRRLLQRRNRLRIIFETCLRHPVLHVGDRHIRLLRQHAFEQRHRILIAGILDIKHGVMKQVGDFNPIFGINPAQVFVVMRRARVRSHVT